MVRESRSPSRSKTKAKTANQTLMNCDLKNISALTSSQKNTFRSHDEGKNVLMYGAAGTGKSYISLYLGLRELFSGKVENLIIVRNTVASKDVGFLPGTLEEKLGVFELAYRDMVGDLVGRGDGYDLLKRSGVLQFTSTSYLRGLTWDRSFVIIDEAQNLTMHELSSTLTRIGEESRVIICGDLFQNDLTNTSKKSLVTGFDKMIKIANKMESFDTIEFTISDIVRSGFVKEFLETKYKLGVD